MPAKKEAARKRRADRPDDPSYQEPLYASDEEIAVLDEDVSKRLKALLADHKRMGAR